MKPRKYSIDERWEKGIPHDERSLEVYHAIAKLDFDEGGDALQLQCGGDGDNGEHLMYLLDLYFEDIDNADAQRALKDRMHSVMKDKS